MSKNQKILIGVLTCLPLLFGIWYVISIFSLMGTILETTGNDGSTPPNPKDIFSFIQTILIPASFTVLLTIGLVIYYLVDILSRNPKFKTETGNNKVIWVLVVLFTGVIGMLVYFFVEIWPRVEGEEYIHQSLDIDKKS